MNIKLTATESSGFLFDMYDSDENLLSEPLLKDKSRSNFNPGANNVCSTPVGPRGNVNLHTRSSNDSFEQHYYYALYSTASIAFTTLSIGFMGISFWFPWSTVSSVVSADTPFTAINFDMNMPLPLYTSISFHPEISIMYPYQLNHMKMIVLSTAIVAPAICWILQLITIVSIRRKHRNWNHLDDFNNDNSTSTLNCPIQVFIDKTSYDSLCKMLSYGLVLANISMTPVYIHLLLNICFSNVRYRLVNSHDIVPSDEISQDIIIETRAQFTGAGLSYMLGIMSGVISMLILKSHLICCKSLDRCDFEIIQRREPNHPFIASPPPIAFRMMSRNTSERHQYSSNHNMSESLDNIDSILETENQEHISSDSDTCDGHEDETVVVRNALTCNRLDSDGFGLNQENQSIEFRFSKLLSFETGLIATLLFLPTITIPVLKIRYDGTLAPVMDQSCTIYYSYSSIIYSVTQIEQNESLIYLSNLIVFLWVFVLPTLIWVVSSTAWFLCVLNKEKLATKLIIYSKYFSPMASPFVFGFAIVSTLGNINTISYHAFDGNMLCRLSSKYIESQTASCTDIVSSFEPMMFFFLFRAFCTEMFLASILIEL